MVDLLLFPAVTGSPCVAGLDSWLFTADEFGGRPRTVRLQVMAYSPDGSYEIEYWDDWLGMATDPTVYEALVRLESIVVTADPPNEGVLVWTASRGVLMSYRGTDDAELFGEERPYTFRYMADYLPNIYLTTTSPSPPPPPPPPPRSRTPRTPAESKAHLERGATAFVARFQKDFKRRPVLDVSLAWDDLETEDLDAPYVSEAVWRRRPGKPKTVYFQIMDSDGEDATVFHHRGAIRPDPTVYESFVDAEWIARRFGLSGQVFTADAYDDERGWATLRHVWVVAPTSQW